MKKKYLFNISFHIENEIQAEALLKRFTSLFEMSDNVFHEAEEQTEQPILLRDYIMSSMLTEQISEGTRHNRLTTVKWLDKLYPDLYLSGIPDDFIDSFAMQLYGAGDSMNTVAKHVAHVRVYLLRAARAGLIDERWLDQHRYSRKRLPYRHCFLSSEELALMEQLPIDSMKAIEKSICSAFLFCCYTGLRFSDVRRITPRDLQREDGVCWIKLKMQKTNQDICIPVSLLFKGKGLKFLPHEMEEQSPIFPLKDNSYTNKVLKKWGNRLGIGKKMSFHVARHTFATQCIRYGIPTEVIQRLLGHQSIKTTQIYAEMTQQTMANSLKDINWQADC